MHRRGLHAKKKRIEEVFTGRATSRTMITEKNLRTPRCWTGRWAKGKGLVVRPRLVLPVVQVKKSL